MKLILHGFLYQLCLGVLIYSLFLSGCNYSNNTHKEKTKNLVDRQEKPINRGPTYKKSTTSKDDVSLTLNMQGHGEIINQYDENVCLAPHCITTLKRGQKVSLTALPSKSFRFVSWRGGCAEAEDSICKLVITENIQLTAIFEPILQPTVGTSIAIVPNTITMGRNNERVTMGLPLAPCAATGSDQFKLMDETGKELPVFVKPTLIWSSKVHCPNAPRALKIQFNFDATAGEKTYSWTLEGRNTGSDLTEHPIAEVATNNPLKGALNEPRVFVIHKPSYLVETGIVSPTVIKTEHAYDQHYFPDKWQYDAQNHDYVNGKYAHWLYDKVSTNYIQALRQGDLKFYREAYLSHEFYIDKIEDTGANTSVDDYCIGGFDYQTVASTFSSGGRGCDSKYMYAQPLKLHLALTGDDSWEPEGTASGKAITREEMWLQMATTLYNGSNRSSVIKNEPAVASQGFSIPYTDIGSAYTERNSGFGLQTILNVCELTGNDKVCSWVDTIVNNLYLHQTNNPDGRGNLGYLGHSWHKHQGSYVPWIGELLRDYKDSSRIILGNTVGSARQLKAGNIIRIRGQGDILLSAAATQNKDNSWTLELSKPVSGRVGTMVNGGNEGDGNVNYLLESDRIFSPWMLSIIGDGLWQYYQWTDSQIQKDKVQALLNGFAHAYAAYALDATRINSVTRRKVEQAFDVVIKNSSITAKTGCGLKKSPYLRYVANDLMANPNTPEAYIRYMHLSGGFADQHTPEGLFTVALGIHFEKDETKKQAMQLVALDMLEWFDKWNCTSGNISKGSPLNDPYRAYSWQNKSDPFGTYRWVMEHSN